MEVQETLAVGQVGFAEFSSGEEDFGGIEAEFSVLAGGGRPFAFAAR